MYTPGNACGSEGSYGLYVVGLTKRRAFALHFGCSRRSSLWNFIGLRPCQWVGIGRSLLSIVELDKLLGLYLYVYARDVRYGLCLVCMHHRFMALPSVIS